MTLDQFEHLVLSQQPATTPWQPVTDYSFEARKAAEGPHAELIWQYLIGHGDANVFDYGCGPDGHLVRLLQECLDAHDCHSWINVEGYDPQTIQPHLRRSEPTARQVWDLVICREVLEHCTIREIRRIVGTLCALSRHLVYVTTRFNQQPQSIWDVQISDDLDPTHISLLPMDLLRTLFVLEGFKRRADLEQHMDHRHKGRVLVYERA